MLAVPSTQRVGFSAKAEQVVASWPAAAWQRLSAGEGSQGPRWYDWALDAHVVALTHLRAWRIGCWPAAA